MNKMDSRLCGNDGAGGNEAPPYTKNLPLSAPSQGNEATACCASTHEGPHGDFVALL